MGSNGRGWKRESGRDVVSWIEEAQSLGIEKFS